MAGTLADQPVIDTRMLFAPEREALLELLVELTPEQWQLSTVCDGWSVHDVALHLLWVDISNLSRRRDGYYGRVQDTPENLDDLDSVIAFVNDLNDNWVRGARRMSPTLVQTLLRTTGSEWSTWVSTVDITQMGEPVGWAGPEPAPIWLDIAREFTERWVHQQHIRDATGIPGSTESRFVRPVMGAFAMALPYALRDVVADSGTVACLRITGEGGGLWTAKRQGGHWKFANDSAASDVDGSVKLDAQTAWTLFTRGMSPARAAEEATTAGDPQIVQAILNMVTILA